MIGVGDVERSVLRLGASFGGYGFWLFGCHVAQLAGER